MAPRQTIGGGLMDISTLIKSGLSVIPVAAHTKRPTVDWQRYQSRIPARHEYSAWSYPIAVVGGEVSGRLVCIDFDQQGECYRDWSHSCGVDLTGCYMQRTQSGGAHVVFRLPAGYRSVRNEVLAKRDKHTVLIETRGEGGYFLVAPSDGYEATYGDIRTLRPLPAETVDAMLETARSYNCYERPEIQHHLGDHDDKSPLNAYNAASEAAESTISLLESHGWGIVRRGGITALRRPDKRAGISATFGAIPGRFYVFTSSTEFDCDRSYSPAAVYAILEHNGDFRAAAMALSDRGYGVKPDPKPSPKKTGPVRVATAIDIADGVRQYYRMPRKRGCRTGLHEQLDEHVRWAKGYLHIVTGIPSHGKSTFVDEIMVLLSKKHGWRWDVYSPENYPFEVHQHLLAEKYWRESLYNKPDLIERSIHWSADHFSFLGEPDDDSNGITLDSIFDAVGDADGLLVDPWNEVEVYNPDRLSETEYIGQCLSRLRRFARKRNKCVIVVAHPMKMRRDPRARKYPIPSLYDISSSAHWYNKADVGISIYRDFDAEKTIAHVQKIKFRWFGKRGNVQFRWSAEGGVYNEIEDAGF